LRSANHVSRKGCLCNLDPGLSAERLQKENRNVHRLTIQPLIALILVASLSLGMAAAPAVGIVTAWGSFTIDASSISGNATLFEGNQIETGKVSSRLQLNTGAKVQLAAESRGIVYRDRLVLERGSSRLETAGDYQVEALSLRIRSESHEATAVVSLLDSGTLAVGALHGPVSVTNAAGREVANVAPGNTVELRPAAATAADQFALTGCVTRMQSAYLMRDEVAGVTTELRGPAIN